MPNKLPLKREADTVPMTEILPVTVREPVIVWLPLNVFEPVVANDADLATNMGSVSL